MRLLHLIDLPAVWLCRSKQQKVHCAMSAVDRDTVLAVSPDGKFWIWTSQATVEILFEEARSKHMSGRMTAGLTCQSRSQQAWAGGRAKVGVISGKVPCSKQSYIDKPCCLRA
jgi:hypothetical protein